MKKMKILLFIFVSSAILVSCSEKQELVEVKSHTEDTSVIENTDVDFTLKGVQKDVTELSFYELGNSLYWKGWWESLKEKIKILSASWETLENKQKATFLESFMWDYEHALVQRKELCKDDWESSFCKKVHLNITSYRPVDNNWKILEDVSIAIDGIDSGLLQGKNNVSVENKFIHRVQLSKEWYLDYYKKQFVDNSKNIDVSITPLLLKADVEKIISSKTTWEMKTKNFSYTLEPGMFKTSTWEVYSGRMKVYFFDIGEEDGDLNVLNLDVFDAEGNYNGGSMVTHGMPLVKAYDMKGNELSFAKGVIGKWKIHNQTKAVWMDLEWVPKNIWLWKKELEKYKVPAFWRLNQSSGVWEESKMKILDSEWNYEFRLN